MLVKAVLVFLIAMAGLAMVGKALGMGRRAPPRLGKPVLCPRCGRLPKAGRCDCGAPSA
jgi:hypothetical protein